MGAAGPTVEARRDGRGTTPRLRSRQRATPLYYWVASVLRDRIEAGLLPAHERIPSERQLAEEFAISRMTARQAVQTLLADGYVYRRNRRGTFVAGPRIGFTVGSFSETVIGRGRRPGARVLTAETVEPDEFIAEALGLKAGERVHFVQRLRSVEGEPVSIENAYLVARLCPDLLRHDLSSSLWGIMKAHYGVTAAYAQASVKAIALDQFEAQMLGSPPGSPAILLTRVIFDEEGRAMEFARDVYRGDRTEFQVGARVDAASETFGMWRPVGDGGRSRRRRAGAPRRR